MADEVRDRANKLSDAERESLLGDAMRIIYSSMIHWFLLKPLYSNAPFF